MNYNIDSETEKLILEEIKGSFDFFWNESNGLEDKLGYGLTRDIAGKKICSIAAVGFAFCAYVIGVKFGFITREQGYERCFKTFKTLEKVASKKGFFIHFINEETLEDLSKEYSTIDTAILAMGAICAGEFFGGDVKRSANDLAENIDWEYLVTEVNHKKVFRMAFSDKIWQDNDGWCHANWDSYAEQLMMYILYAGQKNSNKELAQDLYFGFDRPLGSYKGDNLVYCFGNALFIHQFSHCFFDFSKYVDKMGFNWFINSKNATLANRQYCIDLKWSKTYNENSWGLTAFEGKEGYKVFGSPPFGYYDKKMGDIVDGSVAPYAALSSIVFTPNESIAALKYFNTMPLLKGKYGLTDSYNFEGEKPYYSSSYLGIDKGPTIVMLANFLDNTIYDCFMSSDICKRAIEVLEFKKTDEVYEDFTKGNSLLK